MVSVSKYLKDTEDTAFHVSVSVSYCRYISKVYSPYIHLMYLLYLTLKTENEVHHRLATISVTIFDIMY